MDSRAKLDPRDGVSVGAISPEGRIKSALRIHEHALIIPSGRGPMDEVLVVDDDPLVAQVIASVLEAHGLKAIVVHDLQSALRSMEHCHPVLILTDQELATSTGLELARTARVRWPHVPIMLMGGSLSASDANRAREIGVVECLAKPFSATFLIEAIARVLHTAVPRVKQ